VAKHWPTQRLTAGGIKTKMSTGQKCCIPDCAARGPIGCRATMRLTDPGRRKTSQDPESALELGMGVMGGGWIVCNQKQNKQAYSSFGLKLAQTKIFSIPSHVYVYFVYYVHYGRAFLAPILTVRPCKGTRVNWPKPKSVTLGQILGLGRS
jgi:hypothetical protein